MHRFLTSALLIGFFCLTGASARADFSFDGKWEPVVDLRDRTDHFPGKPNRPKPPDGWWVTPIHASLLTDGKVLINGWGRYDRQDCQFHRTRQNGESFILDPRDFTGGSPRTHYISPIHEAPREGTEDVLYCAGHVTLKDGRILFVGGARYLNLGDKPGEQEYGLNYFRLFDPATRSFSQHEFAPQGSPKKGPGMGWYEDGMMWYPTETRLPGGKVLVAGGFTSKCTDSSCMNRDLEIFDPEALIFDHSPWKTWVYHSMAPDTYDPGIKDYTHTFLLPRPVPAELGGGVERQLVLMGWPGKMAFLSLDEGLQMRDRVYVPASDQFMRPGRAAAWDSSAALVGTGEIMVMGGGPNPKAEAQRIDLYNPWTGRWRSKGTGITRHNPALTLLPDGTVLIVNGERGDGPNGEVDGDPSALGDRHRPQVYDPYTDRLTTLPPWDDANPKDRGYHSFALLLKDGRVMLGGGMVGLGQVGCERPDARVFSPPYLFKGERPVVRTFGPAPFEARLGGSFTLEVTGPRVRADRGVVLMALGSETHSFDQNQRYVPLRHEVLSDGKLRVFSPRDAFEAPEGDYVLYVISEGGAPSEGRIARVR